MKVLEDRALEIIAKVGRGTFPTYSQITIMLKAEGYLPQEVDRWFAGQAAELLDGETEERLNFLNRDVYLVVDSASKVPLTFWTEGKRRITPLDLGNSAAWQAANALRSTLRSNGIIRQD